MHKCFYVALSIITVSFHGRIAIKTSGKGVKPTISLAGSFPLSVVSWNVSAPQFAFFTKYCQTDQMKDDQMDDAISPPSIFAT
jgi:hypothetical protein